MTDSTNTKGMTLESEVPAFSVPEGIAKNWEGRKKSSSLQFLAEANNVDLEKFNKLMNNASKTYTANTSSSNGIDMSKLIGVVAGYK